MMILKHKNLARVCKNFFSFVMKRIRQESQENKIQARIEEHKNLA